jgi:hypothetical protein
VIVFVMPLNYVLRMILSSQLAGEGFLQDRLPQTNRPFQVGGQANKVSGR